MIRRTERGTLFLEGRTRARYECPDCGAVVVSRRYHAACDACGWYDDAEAGCVDSDGRLRELRFEEVAR